MYIIPSQVEKYCNKIGDEIHIEVDLEDKNVMFRFVRGKFEMHGNTAVFLSGQEIRELLELNNIIGKGSQVEAILHSTTGDKDETIHDLIYNTIAKYALQMLNTAMGKDYFPDMAALPQHYETYFHRHSSK
ncbi:hypothetical protein [Flaviaesturariibacter aridisoli]|uniref:Uncharacterized protein n=1 Tax=Flaviaesturariibacter aridisoli TaxID=2545761 RepID=A0A4V2WLU0_9BACT|nr:hypothetical protein [Flaviaesturariibacter aridisoli]TCZ64637.1 hypothetical protein E0486_18110 [Flaviaesturariibacter aridisoli]